MSLAVIKSRAKLGIEAPIVSVEVHFSNGLPALSRSIELSPHNG
jgi:magnesium chelatase family protein